MSSSSGTPSPRTDPLTREVVELIGAVVGRYHEEYEEAAAGHSLTGAQARVLGLLSLEPLPMRRIAQKLKCEPSNITGIVDRLEARGLVETPARPGRPPRKAGGADGRGRPGGTRPPGLPELRPRTTGPPLARGAGEPAGAAAQNAGRGVLGLAATGRGLGLAGGAASASRRRGAGLVAGAGFGLAATGAASGSQGSASASRRRRSGLVPGADFGLGGGRRGLGMAGAGPGRQAQPQGGRRGPGVAGAALGTGAPGVSQVHHHRKRSHVSVGVGSGVGVGFGSSVVGGAPVGLGACGVSAGGAVAEGPSDPPSVPCSS
ncbi:hypothetical protein SALBM135S_02213 [Streptomyces alboniger]